jgi:uncharacterized protein with PQ loop repeat
MIYPNTLLPVSVNSLVTTLVVVLMGAPIGIIVDKLPRRPLLLGLLAVQKLAIAGITLTLWWLNVIKSESLNESISLDCRFILVVVLSAILRIANTGTQISIERDWVVRIANSQTELTKLNSDLKRVDLLSKISAPLFISLIMLFTSISVTMLIISILGLICWIMEFICINLLYRTFDKLHYSKNQASSQDDNQPISLLKLVYRPEFLTCIAASILYFNVLSFGPVMISYLLNKNFPVVYIALVRAGAVLIGLIATLTYTRMVNRLGLIRFGLWSIWTELLFLTIACSCFFITQENTTAMIVLLFGVCLSRWGLWSFDIVQTQILQEYMDFGIGRITGIQVSLQNLFDLLSYAATIYWYSPDNFWIPSLISLGMLLVSCVIYSAFSYKTRGHFIHWEKIGLLPNKE